VEKSSLASPSVVESVTSSNRDCDRRGGGTMYPGATVAGAPGPLL
jgi:hypothetical protein